MLEKLIIELGGVVPKDLLGAGQDESSKSLLAGLSPGKKAADLTDPGTQASAANAENSQGNATGTIGGDVL